MSIHDDPRDIDHEWPVPARREIARERLEQLFTESDIAQRFWNGYVAPLYDALAAQAVYSARMRCRICGRPHPASPTGQAWKAKGKPVPAHATWCAHYTGPLTHTRAKTEKAVTGWKHLCTCGESYPAEDGAQCPRAHVDWRGPRP